MIVWVVDGRFVYLFVCLGCCEFSCLLGAWFFFNVLCVCLACVFAHLC